MALSSNGSKNDHNCVWPVWHENKPYALAILLVLAFLVVFLMAKTGETIRRTKEIGKAVPYEHQITVDGVGKVSGVPDIATVSMGIDTKGDTVAVAQQQNTDAMNALIAAVVALDVSKDDIQTSNYNVYENTVYDPDSGETSSDGWTVSQSLSIKVRDTSKISAVLDAAGKNGATNIYGPNFTIDDTSNLKNEAREEAIADATEKAEVLSETLGVRLERVVGYSEWSDSGYPMPYYSADLAAGMGGASIEVLPGTDEVTLNVSITFKLVE